MKVLYVGIWKDGTGWGNAAQNYILALDKAGIEVVPRAIILNKNDKTDIPARILELEENNESNCDVCIQHLLPDMMEPHGKFDINVGMFAYESNHFRNTDWAQHLNTMDQIWVFNDTMVKASINSNVYKPLAVVPHCFDVSLYSQRYEPYPIADTQRNFTFYTAGTITHRKNLKGLLQAFHLEFTPNEPVCLMIKGSIPGASPMESNRGISAIVKEVKESLRLYPRPEDYHNEIIITEWVSTEKMMRIHKTGDCFVLPSYGEAWGIPGFDAMAMGNPVILTNEGGPAEYVQDYHSGLLIDSRQEYCFIKPEEVPVPGVWSGDEKWNSPDLHHLRRLMREVYEDKELRDNLSSNGIDRAYDFSLETIGQKMKGLLEGTIPTTKVNEHLKQKHDINGMMK